MHLPTPATADRLQERLGELFHTRQAVVQATAECLVVVLAAGSPPF